MYNIVVDYTHSYVEPKLSAELATKLTTELRYHPDGYKHTWYYKSKKWDGYNYCFNVNTQAFRTGLVWRVGLTFERAGIDYKIQDKRQRPEVLVHVGDIDLSSIKPYTFQDHAALATMRQTHGVIASPTGTGKTIIMALIAKLHKCRTLIVVNSRVLLDQTYEYFDQVVPGGVGIVGSGDFELKDVTIATMQSLGTILRLSEKQQKKTPSIKEQPLRDWLDNVGLVVHDEVHEADSASIDKLYGKLKAYSFIGTTATPYAWAHATEKGKNIEMEQHFGRKIYDSRGEVDFVGLGITVPLVVYRPYMPRVSKYQNYQHERAEEESRDVVQAQVIDNEERIEKLVQLAGSMVEKGKSCYVFYQKIVFGELLCDAMRKYDPVMLQGKTSRSVRNQTFKDVDARKQLLVVSDIGGYGLNIRALDSIMIAYPAKDARQLKGRTCRAHESKTEGLVFDPVDDVPYLFRHAELRKNQYKKDKDLVVG
ncbi:DEAD/DEAH box helicase family protein [Candidatus Pacearchaeota archaeon]|nr:DEAD/DEAH box helicase family protein [Candidatus Pacearchaeota archaeon]